MAITLHPLPLVGVGLCSAKHPIDMQTGPFGISVLGPGEKIWLKTSITPQQGIYDYLSISK